MGELVAGRPALRLDAVVSLPLDLVSVMSLLYRAVPGSGLDPWLVATRRSLPPALRADLDLLHGFSGRLLYYMEEPVVRFAPLAPDRRDADFADLTTFLDDLSAADYRAMADHALARVHRDLGSDLAVPSGAEPDPETAWRRYLEPGLTTATAEEVLPLLLDPDRLKTRTLDLLRGVWETVSRDDYAARRPELREAARLAQPAADRGLGLAFADLTGNRLPATLVGGLTDVECIAFCPSAHLGTFVSYILYPPDLVVFFGAPELIARRAGNVPTPANLVASNGATPSVADLGDDALLAALRALGDPNRLRVLELLGGDELYAQEIVGRLGIAQSAVSRHLALLERAGLLTVRPRGGMKYYAVDRPRLDALAEALRALGRASSAT